MGKRDRESYRVLGEVHHRCDMDRRRLLSRIGNMYTSLQALMKL